MKRILFLDFDDSFTHNVVQELRRPEVSIDVCRWDSFTGTSDHDLLVLGPGPGHPHDYVSIHSAITNWMKREKNIFGVCLGHQLFWYLRGATVEKSKYPLHGQKITLNISKEWGKYLEVSSGNEVQRYNSLCVKDAQGNENELLHYQMEELVMSLGPKHITYQFHPESVGTKCRPGFFEPVFSHLV